MYSPALRMPVVPPPDHEGMLQEPLNLKEPDGWIVQWREKKASWTLQTPMLKECKKRRESFAKFFHRLLYKAPYKYHLMCSCSGMTLEENVQCQASLNFENGEQIGHGTDGEVLTNGNRSLEMSKFEHSEIRTGSLEVIVGPFQFNVCSFRQDGRKFRLILHIFASPMNSGSRLTCSLVSPPFTIRAKKPIRNPGSRRGRGSKRNRKSTEPAPKRRREAPVPVPVPSLPSAPIHIPHQGQGPMVPVVGLPPTNRSLPAPPTSHFGIPFSPTPQLPYSQLPMGVSVPPSLFQNSFAPPPHPQPGMLTGRQVQQQGVGVQPPPAPGFPPRQVPLQVPRAAGSASQMDLADFLLSEQEPEKRTDQIVSDYSAMDTNKRIQLLQKLLEISFPHELQYVQMVFFNDEATSTSIPEFDEMDKLVDDDGFDV